MAVRLQIFITINLQYIYQGMWTFAVTCRAECIWLLVDRHINICHKVRSLSTSMQPHRVYSKHNDLLHSYYWKLEVNPTYGAELAHWTVIFVPVTQHLRGHQLYSKKNVGAYFLPWQFKNLANTRQAPQVLWGCVKQWWQLSGIILLFFVFLWLSFKLWIWQRELNCFNSLP